MWLERGMRWFTVCSRYAVSLSFPCFDSVCSPAGFTYVCCGESASRPLPDVQFLFRSCLSWKTPAHSSSDLTEILCLDLDWSNVSKLMVLVNGTVP